jgi:hypothetical protein
MFFTLGLSVAICEEERPILEVMRALPTLNAITMKDKYSLPHINILFD